MQAEAFPSEHGRICQSKWPPHFGLDFPPGAHHSRRGTSPPCCRTDTVHHTHTQPSTTRILGAAITKQREESGIKTILQ